MLELLTPSQMAEADRLTIASGAFDGAALMERAGAAVGAEALRRFPAAASVHVLCGPGNNGGDGYVAARLLAEQGVEVRLHAFGIPRPRSDAANAAARCRLPVATHATFAPEPGDLIVDALFGAGLAKPVEGLAAEAIERANVSGAAILAVDLPSGISGDNGAVQGTAIRADATVTFFRNKPGHLLQPGRNHCGEIIVAEIGIASQVLDSIGPRAFENGPALWRAAFPRLVQGAHKYSRGHVAVFSGGHSSTGAARLSALAAARAGAGAVTMLSPDSALLVNAVQLTSVILRKAGSMEEVGEFLEERRPAALVFGPGLGTRDKVGDFALSLIEVASGRARHIVFDADAITLFARNPDSLYAAARRPDAPALVLTPHEGEFRRLFPDLAADAGLSKLDRARHAAARANCTVIYKGPDTVIAAPDGRAAINANGTPLLATAGSGDVLSGIAAGLLAQGMPPFEAACAAVWLHAEAARSFGPGLIAEDLPLALCPVLRDLAGATASERVER